MSAIGSALLELREALDGGGLGGQAENVRALLEALDELSDKLQRYEGESVIFTPSACKNCSAPIVWIHMATSNRLMPCNPRRLLIVTPEGRMVKGHESHFADCPGANALRKKK